MRKTVTIASLFLLTACGNRGSIEQAVRETLIDPDSAKFGEVVEYNDKDGTPMACVMANSKNRMGGYTGEQMFLAMRNKEGLWKAQGLGAGPFDCSTYMKVKSS